MAPAVLQESDCKDDCASRSGQPSLDGSLEARKSKRLCWYCLHLHLSRVLRHYCLTHATAVRPPSHESASLSAPALIHGIPVQLQLQRRHNSQVLVCSASLVLGHARTYGLIQGIGSTSQSSIELVLEYIPQPSSPPLLALCAWATHLTSMGVRER